jgi:hypothetical protein
MNRQKKVSFPLDKPELAVATAHQWPSLYQSVQGRGMQQTGVSVFATQNNPRENRFAHSCQQTDCTAHLKSLDA